MLVLSTLGPDVVTGSGPYTHVMSLKNQASTGSQPQSLTLDYFDAVNPWQVAGAQPGRLRDHRWSGQGARMVVRS